MNLAWEVLSKNVEIVFAVEHLFGSLSLDTTTTAGTKNFPHPEQETCKLLMSDGKLGRAEIKVNVYKAAEFS